MADPLVIGPRKEVPAKKENWETTLEQWQLLGSKKLQELGVFDYAKNYKKLQQHTCHQ